MKRDAPGADETFELHKNPEDDWLSFEFGEHTLFVHPPSKRVCTTPDGNVVGEFDVDEGEVRLFAEDAEADGAVEPQICEITESHGDKHTAWVESFTSRGLVRLGGRDETTLLREGLLEGIRCELELMLGAAMFSDMHGQPAEVRRDRVAYLQTSDPDVQSSRNTDRGADELLDAIPCPPHCTEAMKLLEGLAAVLNRHLHLGLLRPRRCMAACYESGGFYVAHRDNDMDTATGAFKNRRAVTAILYANKADWPVDHGGALRCHMRVKGEDDGDYRDETVDVQPAGGQIILFDSKRLLHEVMPTTQRRLALTVWFVTA